MKKSTKSDCLFSDEGVSVIPFRCLLLILFPAGMRGEKNTDNRYNKIKLFDSKLVLSGPSTSKCNYFIHQFKRAYWYTNFIIWRQNNFD